MKSLITLIISILITSLLYSQSEAELKEALEGKRVEILIELPASSEGIDIYADRVKKMDFDDYSKRIKKYGIALFPGDIVMITKIKTKGKHIEFHLAGGGFGTWGDDQADVSSDYIPKSSRQEELEKMLKEDKNKTLPNRRKLENELKDLERERSIAQNESERQAALESEMKKSRIADQRLQGGSRFNIRYNYKIDRNEMTLSSIKNALKGYVNFNRGRIADAPSILSPSNATLSKGMTMEDAMRILGIPKNLSSNTECGLEQTICEFEKDGQFIKCIFVEKILVKYSVSSL